jgi:hypothetical protein
MKFLMTLIASLILNNTSMAGEDLPIFSILPNSLKLELPIPQKEKREKYIITTSDNNGFVCHNFYREIEIKNKLFELKTNADLIPKLELKAIENKPPITLIKSNIYTTVLISFLSGAIITLALKSK